MKIVLFSDLHLDAVFRWVPPDVARKRRQALRDTLVRIAEVTCEVRADALVCGGGGGGADGERWARRPTHRGIRLR